MSAKAFLVISYNWTEHKGIRDHVIANRKEQALEFVAGNRPEVQVVDCLDSADLADHAKQIRDIAEGYKVLVDLEHVAGIHTKDSDCTVGEDGCCISCGVSHTQPCGTCGGAGFHLLSCSEMDS